MKMLQLFESCEIIGGENVFRTAFSKRKRIHGQVNSPRGHTVGGRQLRIWDVSLLRTNS
jgi:hypothetical protein